MQILDRLGKLEQDVALSVAKYQGVTIAQVGFLPACLLSSHI